MFSDSFSLMRAMRSSSMERGHARAIGVASNRRPGTCKPSLWIGRSWSRRLAAGSVIAGTAVVTYSFSGSYFVSIMVSGSLLLAGAGLLQLQAMRSTRHLWQDASEVFIAVLKSLNNDHGAPQQQPTWINLALLYRVQRHEAPLLGRYSSPPPSSSSSSPAPASPAATLIAPERESAERAVSPAALREALRYMAFATSAYGHAAMVAFGPRACKRAPSTSALLKGADAVNLEALIRHCGIGEADVIMMREADEAAACPAFFIALDRAHASIVLSVRGTASIYDAVVLDLVCVAESFAGGLAHSGMARAARALRHAVIPTLARLAHEHRGFRLVLTGHSMGGGVAALLTVLLHHERRRRAAAAAALAAPGTAADAFGADPAQRGQGGVGAGGLRGGLGGVGSGGGDERCGGVGGCGTSGASCGGGGVGGIGDGESNVVIGAFGSVLQLQPELPSDTPISCITFAAPPVYAPSHPDGRLPPELSDSIISYVHHADVVPSLSLANVRRLLASLREIDRTRIASTRKRLAVLSGRIAPPAELLAAVRSAVSSACGGGGGGTEATTTTATSAANAPGASASAACAPHAAPSPTGMPTSSTPRADPPLQVPSRDVVTLTHIGGGRYEASACSAEAYVSRGIRLAPSMASDHVFGFYEAALASCTSSTCTYEGKRHTDDDAPGDEEKAV